MLEEAQNIFEQYKYVHIPGFLDFNNCNEYVFEFKKLIEQKAIQKDDQVPEADTLACHPLFDSLLEQLTPQIEAVTKKKLFPTYSYARWYKTGNELLFHRDRASCEYSVTITLGMNGNPWPILMANPSTNTNDPFNTTAYGQKFHHAPPSVIPMQIGDAVIYKGEEVWHWREKYKEGEWQLQVFLHYVDQEGPHKDFKYDKRPKLAHHENNNLLDGTFTAIKCFSKESCAKIIEGFENHEKIDALLIGNILDKEIRDCKKVIAGNQRGVGATLTGIGLNANKHIWNFDITHSNQCEYLVYDKEGHFAQHTDTILSDFTNPCRKLTCLLILNDEFEGGKFFIQAGMKKTYPEQTPGTVIIFPSFLLHGVEPVTSGIRRSIVTWLVGPYFK